MDDALDVYTRRRVDVVWAQTEYGPELKHQDPRFPRFLCPLCLAGLHVVRPAPENGTPHFAHHDGAVCDAVEAGRLRYAVLRDDGEQDDIERLKADFADRWPWIYKRLSELVGNLSYKEFIEILNLSLRDRVWEYRHLDIGQLPYVFALMIDFTKKGGFPRRARFRRFWLLPGLPGHYWMWPEQASQLCRGEFITPRNGDRPGAEDLIDFEIINPNRDYLAARRPFINPDIVDIMGRWLRRNGFPAVPR